MEVVAYSKKNQDSEFFAKVIDWCEAAANEQTPAAVNHNVEDWHEDEKSLPYILYHKNRYDRRGEYFFLLDQGKIVAGSGIYRSDFCYELAIGGSRTYVNPDHRAKWLVAKYLLPAQLRWAERRSYHAVALTFNEYNKKVINAITRTGLGIKKNRTPDMMFYDGVYTVDHPVVIKNTLQWIIYHKINKDFEFDWSSISSQN